jgi:hypothetical protein
MTMLPWQYLASRFNQAISTSWKNVQWAKVPIFHFVNNRKIGNRGPSLETRGLPMCLYSVVLAAICTRFVLNSFPLCHWCGRSSKRSVAALWPAPELFLV